MFFRFRNRHSALSSKPSSCRRRTPATSTVHGTSRRLNSNLLTFYSQLFLTLEKYKIKNVFNRNRLSGTIYTAGVLFGRKRYGYSRTETWKRVANNINWNGISTPRTIVESIRFKITIYPCKTICSHGTKKPVDADRILRLRVFRLRFCGKFKLQNDVIR